MQYRYSFFKYHQHWIYQCHITSVNIRFSSCKKQEMLSFREQLSSTPDSWWIHVAHLFIFVFLNSVCGTFSAEKQCSVCLYLQLFVGGLMSYLRYVCSVVHSGVQHILCCAFILFFFGLFALCCQFLWIVLSILSLPYSLTFIIQ